MHVLPVLMATALLAACSATAALNPLKNASSRVKVVATFSILADFVANIGGDLVDVISLVGPGSDVHEFEPAPSDIARIADADVIVENGLGLESWLAPLVTASRSAALRVTASNGVSVRKIASSGRTDIDPHIWQDPVRAMQMVANIRDALTNVDPAHAARYMANAATYLEQIKALDSELQSRIAVIPPGKRTLVTSHDSLSYFAERYGFTVVGSALGSLSTEATDPSAREFAALVDVIKTSHASVIFLESITRPERVEKLAHETGVRIGPPLFTDALGPANTPTATYLSAMRFNAGAITTALG